MDEHAEDGKGKQRATEVLEIEDEEQRHERIRKYIRAVLRAVLTCLHLQSVQMNCLPN